MQHVIPPIVLSTLPKNIEFSHEICNKCFFKISPADDVFLARLFDLDDDRDDEQDDN